MILSVLTVVRVLYIGKDEAVENGGRRLLVVK